MKKRLKKWMYSLRFRMTISIVLIAVMFLVIVLQYHFHTVSLLQRDSKDVLHQRLNIRLMEAQRDLEKVDSFLQSRKGMMAEFESLFHASGNRELQDAQSKIEKSYRSALEEYDFLDGFYLYQETESLFLLTAKDPIPEEIQESLTQEILQLLQEYEQYSPTEKSGWIYIRENGYFIRVLENYGMYTGAFFSAKTLETWLKPEEIHGAKLILPDELIGGSVLARARSGVAGFDLVVYERGGFQWEDLGRYGAWLAISMTGLLLFTLLIRRLLHREIVKPLDQLVHAMNQPEEERKSLLQEKASCEEFQTVYDSMNEMIDRIQGLDRQVYQEQLQKRKISLQYLQLQINPHFLINCMNLIRNLVYMGRAAEVEKVTIEMGNYMRYVMRSAHWVSLEEELTHVETYIFLQKYRYEEYLEYQLDVTESAKQCRIPIMLLQTFVENAVKHQGNYERHLKICISASIENERLHVQITDNGDGFAPEILQKLENREPIFDELGEHVGILNICRRLELFYEENAEISFHNRKEGGALICICLPAENDSEKYRSSLDQLLMD